MQPAAKATWTVDAKVDQVLPQFGLAYVRDNSSRSWGVTRSTPGSQFDTLAEGRRIRLEIEEHPTFSMVRECKVLD